MQCKKCRQDIPDNSAYCNICGTKQIKENRTQKPKTRGNGLVQFINFRTVSGVLLLFLATVLMVEQFVKLKAVLELKKKRLWILNSTHKNGH